ncbi:MAG TPA: 30S ribosomal protein S6 [Candidatus Paceibacterota bacterium]|nr:30S ribosomal protein S6 [Candidatus Paceibacterota bacterium]
MDSSDKNVYELGYLLIPIIAPEKLADEVNAIRALVESNGGLVLFEEAPKERKLAYEMSHDITGGRRAKYDDAFFGWMKFNLSADAVSKLDAGLKNNQSLIRYLIINLTKEGGDSNGAAEAKKPLGVGKKPKKTVSEKELDKEIDNLLDKTA